MTTWKAIDVDLENNKNYISLKYPHLEDPFIDSGNHFTTETRSSRVDLHRQPPHPPRHWA